jgi:hypothetical protein
MRSPFHSDVPQSALEVLAELDAYLDYQVYLSGNNSDTHPKAMRDADQSLPDDYQHCVIVTERMWDKIRAALKP